MVESLELSPSSSGFGSRGATRAIGSQTPVVVFILYPGGHGSTGGVVPSSPSSPSSESVDSLYLSILGAYTFVKSVVGVYGLSEIVNGVVSVVAPERGVPLVVGVVTNFSEAAVGVEGIYGPLVTGPIKGSRKTGGLIGNPIGIRGGPPTPGPITPAPGLSIGSKLKKTSEGALVMYCPACALISPPLSSTGSAFSLPPLTYSIWPLFSISCMPMSASRRIPSYVPRPW